MVVAHDKNMIQSESLTVCLVDDDPMMGTLFSRVIQRAGCNVIVVGDALRAISALEEHEIDLVLSDLMMPDFSDGENLLKNIKTNYPDMPVFMMSGNMCLETQMRLVDLGANACLMKPFTADAFKNLIATIGSDQ